MGADGRDQGSIIGNSRYGGIVAGMAKTREAADFAYGRSWEGIK